MLRQIFLIFVALVAVAQWSSAAPAYQITDLSGLFGNGGEVASLNNHGDVIGNLTLANGSRGSFLYRNGSTQVFALFYYGALVSDINDAAIIVGSYYISDFGPKTNPFSLQISNGIITRPAIAIEREGFFGAALRINNANMVYGFSYEGPLWGTSASYNWISGTSIGKSFDFRTPTYGRGFLDYNDAGKVVGTVTTLIDNSWQPFRPFFFFNGEFRDLSSLIGAEGIPRLINNRDEIFGDFVVDGDNHVFRLIGNELEDLTEKTGLLFDPVALNDSGDLVFRLRESGRFGILKEDGEVIDLDAIVQNICGWTLTSIRKFNNAGQMVGRAKDSQNQTHSFLLTPLPENSPLPSVAPKPTPLPETLPTPTPSPSPTPTPDSTATPTPSASPTPTPDSTATPTPSASPTPTPDPTATPNPSTFPTPDPTAPPTATIPRPMTCARVIVTKARFDHDRGIAVVSGRLVGGEPTQQLYITLLKTAHFSLGQKRSNVGRRWIKRFPFQRSVRFLYFAALPRDWYPPTPLIDAPDAMIRIPTRGNSKQRP